MENYKVFTYKKGIRYLLQEFTNKKNAIDYAHDVGIHYPGKIIVVEKETTLHEIIKTIEG